MLSFGFTVGVYWVWGFYIWAFEAFEYRYCTGMFPPYSYRTYARALPRKQIQYSYEYALPFGFSEIRWYTRHITDFYRRVKNQESGSLLGKNFASYEYEYGTTFYVYPLVRFSSSKLCNYLYLPVPVQFHLFAIIYTCPYSYQYRSF